MKKILVILIIVLTCSCKDHQLNEQANEKITLLKTKIDSLLQNIKEKASMPAEKPIKTFLTFQENNAEEAMNFYVGLFENSNILDVQRYGKDGPAKEGTIMVATFELNGSRFACSDSYIKHAWGFSPAVSIWVECKTNEEIENLLAKLSENGKILMPLDNYGFSSKFTFLEDRFGVSWQLNLK
ncbi:3-demethylubiquinone-9 3-methyltransferase [Kordia sp. SMS9]|uniref:VOC family protein n=1 Tax=Kordia sp. SMS9 TaxID=2282170 RepID=UPI000E101098|nr:VOC family protein [Kordia sp. SMS9]AXG69374.1 3-demethylubiquinone-9 3-methyltransferase [Kordia sp. SMS9]